VSCWTPTPFKYLQGKKRYCAIVVSCLRERGTDFVVLSIAAVNVQTGEEVAVKLV
jgi:hypothetical protein